MQLGLENLPDVNFDSRNHTVADGRPNYLLDLFLHWLLRFLLFFFYELLHPFYCILMDAALDLQQIVIYLLKCFFVRVWAHGESSPNWYFIVWFIFLLGFILNFWIFFLIFILNLNCLRLSLRLDINHFFLFQQVIDHFAQLFLLYLIQ